MTARADGRRTPRSIYVETTIAAPQDRVWARTQDVRQHVRWDARFGVIEPLEGRPGERMRFRYATLGVAGEGVSTGERTSADGSATSALRFRCVHPLSVIARGSGHWRYVPTPGGTRFLTRYDYVARYPRLDRAFRPVMGWATAWSFDRLRIWLERGTPPERALRLAILDVGWRAAAVLAVALLLPVAVPVALAVVVLVPVPSGVPSGRRPLRRPLPTVAGADR